VSEDALANLTLGDVPARAIQLGDANPREQGRWLQDTSSYRSTTDARTKEKEETHLLGLLFFMIGFEGG
jgi:hypothetical protein